MITCCAARIWIDRCFMNLSGRVYYLKCFDGFDGDGSSISMCRMYYAGILP